MIETGSYKGLLLAAFTLLVFSCSDSAEPVDISFENDIQISIFTAYCFVGCHDGARQGGLELSSYATLMEGGDNGVPIRSGNAEESLLIWRIEGFDNSGIPIPRMPKDNIALSRTEINIIKDWIDQGANDN